MPLGCEHWPTSWRSTRAAIYEGELVQGRHEGEDAERLRIAKRIRALLVASDE